MTSIPFVDLHLMHDQVAVEVAAGFERVLKNTSFVLGPEVDQFEADFAEFCGTARCVGVGNGTDALELALRAAGVGPGDEVILPANTFVATAEAVVRAGATMVLADCDEDFLIDVQDAASRVTGRTRAVIPVHLYGQPAPVEQLRAAVGSGVVVVEDAAQAQGARRNGVRAGALGDVAGTSFYPGKNLGAYGDAGAVVTSSDEAADGVMRLRNHGGVAKYEHSEVGVNSRLDSLQAVVLSAKLPHLDVWNAQRRAAAAYYDALLADVDGVVPPRVLPGNEHVFHLYVVRVPVRDRLVEHLHAHGVGAGVHYPMPVHLLPAFASYDWEPGDFPTAEALAGEILSLPMFPGITPAQQERVVACLREGLSRR